MSKAKRRYMGRVGQKRHRMINVRRRNKKPSSGLYQCIGFAKEVQSHTWTHVFDDLETNDNVEFFTNVLKTIKVMLIGAIDIHTPIVDSVIQFSVEIQLQRAVIGTDIQQCHSGAQKMRERLSIIRHNGNLKDRFVELIFGEVFRLVNDSPINIHELDLCEFASSSRTHCSLNERCRRGLNGKRTHFSKLKVSRMMYLVNVLPSCNPSRNPIRQANPQLPGRRRVARPG